jgi:hypothetical protein
MHIGEVLLMLIMISFAYIIGILLDYNFHIGPVYYSSIATAHAGDPVDPINYNRIAIM